jgi:Ca2+-transporting ATPase
MLEEKLASIFADTKSYRGLSSFQAQEALEKHGFNLREWKSDRNWRKRLFAIITEPMILLILATAFVYLFIGEKLETIIFFASIIPIAFINYFQQRRADRALDELGKIVEEYCKVYRDNKLITEKVKNLVPGDLVFLTSGDKVPADGALLTGSGLMVDESLLTGESTSTPKIPKSEKQNENNHNFSRLFQGTLITQGEGNFLVMTTGLNTEYGKIGSLMEKITKEHTPLQKKINSFIKKIALIAVLFAVMIGIFLVMLYGWRDGLLGGLTMGISLIPEEFPIVFSVFLVMGVWRMAKQKALTRNMTTVETLGSATVVCVDKTGTLTEGRMSLQKIFYNHNVFEIKSATDTKIFGDFMRDAVLAMEKEATDALEIETQRYAGQIGLDAEKIFSGYELINEAPFDANTKMVHHVWRNKQNQETRQYSVGAPESIFEICDMTEAEKIEANQANDDFAKNGLRVVAVAVSKNDSARESIAQNNLQFRGLLAMSDPPRVTAKQSVKMLQQAGIRIIMITGDSHLTASAIAERVGIKNHKKVLYGNDLAKMSPAALRQAVSEYSIYARIKPEQKFLIVEALQQNKEIVAMTGDGVNDAPALKKADIGVAMGMRGTEVAREASDMILLDDDFFTIANAVKEGRKIYRNLQQSFSYLISFHLPIVGLAIFPLFFGDPLIFLPIHVIFLELICDPASVLGFEREKAPKNIMSQKPRPTGEPLIPMGLWLKVIIQGVAIFAVSIGFYLFFVFVKGDHAMARGLAFIALIVSQIMLIFLSREWYQIKNNAVLIIIGVATYIALTFIVFVPSLRALFRLAIVSPYLYASVYAVAFLVMGLTVFLLRFNKKDYGRN